MKSRLNSVLVSSGLLTICLLDLVPAHLRYAATWQERLIRVTENYATFNFEASLAFASLALITIGIIVLWTGYRRRLRSAWVIMVVFVSVYYVPVYLVDITWEAIRVGWPYWPKLLRGAMDGESIAQHVIRNLGIFVLMLIALFLPIRAIFGKNLGLPVADQSSKHLRHEAGADAAKARPII